ncbi:hypothetical protein HV186_17865 [Citrobacter freundii]|uniref:hypothetical protein n=1 Tax=Citrobacter freundii TaxID=546 RepID=UPI0015EADA22|nr:hypothetical protein [Citrobacter freundii]QLY53509.1 hypothetical protein HV186_17865 [Citrobacter freundii]
MSLRILQKAIQQRKPISFEYIKEGKVRGERIGDTHAIFIMRRQDNTESTKVHIVQTGGVTDSAPNFPEFRMFDLSELDNIRILDDLPEFEINSGYNPSWTGYSNVISKV